MLALAGLGVWSGAAHAQTYDVSQVLQLSSTDQPPVDGGLHVGPTTVASAGGSQYRALLRFDLLAVGLESVWSAELVLRDAPCYQGDSPPITAYPIVSDWGPDTAWSSQPDIGEPLGAGSSEACPDSLLRFDVTPLLREWLTGATPMLGIELRGDESIVDPRTYSTSDGETDRLDRRFDPNVPARIVITPPPPPIVPAPPVVPPPPPIVAPPTSGLTRLPVLLEGVLVDELELPVAGGTVAVYQSIDPEGTAEAPQLARATTAPGGDFTIRLSPDDPALLDAAIANDGWVNFDATFTFGSRVTFHSFSSRMNGSTWTLDAYPRVQLDSEASIAAQTTGVRTVQTEPDPNARVTCFVSTTKIGEADRWAVIGEAHVWKDQSLAWTYGERADSDIGVGYSQDGVHWALSGSVHIGTTRGSEIGDTISNLGDPQGNFGRRYRTEFRFAKYRTRQYCPGHSSTVYRVKATRWNGGLDYYDDVKHLNGHCGDTYRSNSVYFEPADGQGVFGRASEDLRTYGLAVSVFGASLSAQSGASKSVTQKWRFGRLFARYYLCGDTGKPSVSERIFAGL
jgi:hypothetical protein